MSAAGSGRRTEAVRLLLAGDELGVARSAAESAGFTLVEERPDVVLCHGGDGTLLRAEQLFPGLPKLTARIGSRARLCRQHSVRAVLEAFAAGTLQAERLTKLELQRAGQRRLALNDVVMRNESPATAVRFSVFGAGLETGEVVGDGVVFATPFGSTGYYRSISRQSFTAGFGAAFNNSTEALAPLRWDGRERLTVELRRGPAVLLVDNRDEVAVLGEGERFEVSGSSEQAVVYGLQALRCQECRRADGAAFNPH
ncbi:MAG: hypothetical protein ACT4PU_02265 [Planctomycetota bacterium]